MSIAGADLSHYQTVVSWNAYAAARPFVFLKASEGTAHVDDRFATFRKGAHAAGLAMVGMYHFAHPGLDSAAAEAAHFLATVGPLAGNEKLVLDIEKNEKNLSKAALGAWAAEFLDHLKAGTGIQPGVYSYGPFFDTMDLTPVRPRAWLWIAGYSTKPPASRGWDRYTFWQHTDKANVAGIQAPCDESVFWSDNLADLAAFAGQGVEQDMPPCVAVTYNGSPAVWMTNGVAKTPFGTPAELAAAKAAGLVGETQTLPQSLLDRIPDAGSVLWYATDASQQARIAAGNGGGSGGDSASTIAAAVAKLFSSKLG